MKAQRAVLKGVRQLEFEEIELSADRLAPDAILARTLYSAVSTGTEVAAYVGAPPLRPGPIYPRKVGYCNVAEVEEVGKFVHSIAPGERILTAQSHQSAFVCAESEVMAVVPGGAPSDVAALSYLVHLGLAALEAGREHLSVWDQGVAVLGLGVIGLATVALAASSGAGRSGRVIAIGNDSSRLALATRLGAHVGYLAEDPALRQEQPNLIVTTANAWSAWQLALELAGFHTCISVLGFPGRTEGAPPFNPLAAEHFYNKQLSIVAAGMPDRPEAERKAAKANLRMILGRLVARPLGDAVEQALPGGREARTQLPLAELITHRVPWHRLGEIYDLAAARDKSLVAAVLDWTSFS